MRMESINQHNGSMNGDNDNSDPGKMFVGGLSWQTSPENLRDYFSKFGEVKECMVMRDPITKRSRGFGFVTFMTADGVEQVLANGPHELDSKVIDPKVAFPRKPSATNQPKISKTKKIFVGGLSASTTVDDVKAYFEQFGKVEDAMLMFDKATQRHRGFAFATFEHEDVVDKVCEIHFHEINSKMVECKKAQPKEVMMLQNLQTMQAAAAAGTSPFSGFLPGYPASYAALGRTYPAAAIPGYYQFPGALQASGLISPVTSQLVGCGLTSRGCGSTQLSAAAATGMALSAWAPQHQAQHVMPGAATQLQALQQQGQGQHMNERLSALAAAQAYSTASGQDPAAQSYAQQHGTYGLLAAHQQLARSQAEVTAASRGQQINVVPGAGGVLSVVNSYAQSYLPPTSPATASRGLTHAPQQPAPASHFPQATSPPAGAGALSDAYTLGDVQGYVQATSPQPSLTGLASSHWNMGTQGATLIPAAFQNGFHH